MEIKLYLRMLQRSWWIMILTALAAVMGVLISAYFSTPIYETHARFIVSPNSTLISGENSAINSLATLDKRSIVNTYAEVLNSNRIFLDAQTLLNTSEAEVEGFTYTAVVLPDTNIIELTVTGSDPAVIASLANGIGQSAIVYIEGLYPIYSLRLMDPAIPSQTPISPRPLRDGLIGAILGLAVGAALALGRELLRMPIENFLLRSTLDNASQALNRRTFEHRLQQVAQDSTEASLCLVHLDGLERYSNVLPQPTLQHILRDVTQSLKNQLRGNDLIGRWNDSQFAVLLSGTPGSAAYNTMSRVQHVLSLPIKTDVTEEALELKPTIGIAGHIPGSSPDALVDQAELALKSANQDDQGIFLVN